MTDRMNRAARGRRGSRPGLRWSGKNGADARAGDICRHASVRLPLRPASPASRTMRCPDSPGCRSALRPNAEPARRTGRRFALDGLMSRSAKAKRTRPCSPFIRRRRPRTRIAHHLPRPIRRHSHQPARLAHVRLAIPRRTLPVEPPAPPSVLSVRSPRCRRIPRDRARRHSSTRCAGFPDGLGGVGLHHQGPGLAGRGRPASEWSYVSPPFDHPKLTRHNGGSMDRLPDVMVDDHKLAGRCFQDADGDLGPRARRLPNPIGRTASCRPRRSSPSRGRAQPWLRASRPPPRGARPE